MKKYILSIISLIIISSASFAQTFEMRTFLNEYDYIAVQLKQTALGGEPNALSSADGITDLTFTLRWLQSYGDVDADIICTNYNITESGTRTTKDTYYYQQFGISLPLLSPDDYADGGWYTVATLSSTLASGSTFGTFELAPDGWAGSLIVTIDWDNDGSSTQYNPSLVTGACDNSPIPTIVYDLVWTGVTDGFWDKSTNWETACGGTGIVPNTGNNCLIPSGLTTYPSDFFAVSFGHQPACDNLRVDPGASLSIKDFDALSTQVTYTINNDFLNYGTTTIVPNGQLEVKGNTHIENANGLVVQAGTAGVGSFLDDKAGTGATTITYGASGSAKVQTYVSNGSIDNSFYMHLMGPTLDDKNRTGPLAGADLAAFNVSPGSTYAYTYVETIDTVGGVSPWVNQSSPAYPVNLTNGIGLSTDDNSAYTMNLEGTLFSGNVPSRMLTTGTNSHEMLSNPWPSAFEFDAFYSNGANNSVIAYKYWVWDPVGGSWNAYIGGSSTTIQVGQAFMVETIGAGTVSYMNINRTHSDVPFRDIKSNWLTLDINGGDYSYHDRTVIRFMEGGTNGYDDAIEAVKWNSMYANATQISSIAEGGTKLSVNTMPDLDLQAEMVSVPVHFDCGYAGEYTFTASDLESFEYGTEIWIEDKQDGNAWHHLSNGHETYTFTAGADDPNDRFIVHFFGPTAVEENEVKNVLVYGDHEYALIRNMTNNEIVKEVYIYSLAGTMILHKQVPEQNMYRFFVSNYDNYYVVKVVTDKNIYTEKVFIH